MSAVAPNICLRKHASVSAYTKDRAAYTIDRAAYTIDRVADSDQLVA
jgi:hypothetical protein